MAAQKRGSINGGNLLTVVSILVLVGIELFGAALAAGWAIAGIFQLGDTVGHLLMAVFCLLAAYGLYTFAQRAIRVEPIRS
ncbi:MAG: hypothetical protein BGP06_10910 [Rhizobiales bacterium 65-9]|nr:hypothetical protein [Hyphomicrobiales bacterium]OJY32843.1 MAG: hypothetical protein BGP06_10910 [Rhizobiales bacterium 65-9]